MLSQLVNRQLLVDILGGEGKEDSDSSKAISLVFLRRMPLLPYGSHFRLSISNEAARFFLNEGDTDEKVVQLLKVLRLLLELLLLFSLNDFWSLQLPTSPPFISLLSKLKEVEEHEGNDGDGGVTCLDCEDFILLLLLFVLLLLQFS